MAIMVAYVCKENPRDYPSQLIKKFFNIFSNWEWPKPVTICEINMDYSKHLDIAWSPKSTHPFPVITPCIHTNCLFKVNEDTKFIILKFMKSADNLLSHSDEDISVWDMLFTQFEPLDAYW